MSEENLPNTPTPPSHTQAYPTAGVTAGGLPASRPDPSERLKADLMLLAVSAVWGSAFVFQRLAAGQIGFFLFNGLRFLLGGFALLPLAVWSWQRGQGRIRRATLPAVALAGVLLMGGSALQQWGMRYTTAANAGFITGLYVVLVPFFLAVGWRRRAAASTWLAAGAAVAGMYLLSTGGQFSANRGDALELGGAVLWALHVILIDLVVRRVDAVQLAVGQYLVCGLLSLGLGLALEGDSLAGLSQAWGSVLYTGLMSVGVGYTLQIFGQRVAPPADAAILLSAESVFAALCGWIFLRELLTPVQVAGCGLILAAMLLAQAPALLPKR